MTHAQFFRACRNGNKSLVMLMIEKDEYDWNRGLYESCHAGHKDITELMISKGANDWNWGLSSACNGGQKDLAELMISKGANDWDRGLISACNTGYKELALMMIEKGANINRWIMINDIELEYLVKIRKDISTIYDCYNYQIRMIKMIIQVMMQIINEILPNDLTILCISY